MRKRTVLVGFVALATMSCGQMGDLKLKADVKLCTKYAQRETSNKKDWPGLINRCMEQQDHLGFEYRIYKE